MSARRYTPLLSPTRLGLASTLALVSALALLGAGSQSGDYETLAPLTLSQTGLYVPGSVTLVAAENRAFSPQYPLWTDGATKSRWVHLPAGAKIDASDMDCWKFPVGTKFWKLFSFAGRRVETRLLWHATEGQWIFATYLWREDQSDADLVPRNGILRSVEIAPGKYHAIPSVADCGACHLAGDNPVLGFNALQLSPDRDPNALHAEELLPEMLTLTTLLRESRLEPSRLEFIQKPPRIESATPVGRSALGYLSANCGGCHNSYGPLSRLGLDFRGPAQVHGRLSDAQILAALSRAAEYHIPDAPPETTRWIHAGNPAFSSVVYRMSSRRPISQMPPLGTALVDREAVDLITRWVKICADTDASSSLRTAATPGD